LPVFRQRKCDSIVDMALETPLQSRVTNSRKSHRTLLLTGFEAFGDDPSGQGLNPSAQVALALSGQRVGPWRIAGEVLPCVFGQAPRVLKRLIAEYQPEAVICLGQAGGRAAISIERIAVNWDEAALPDNAGIVRQGQAILKTAPAAYFSTLPIHAMRDAVQKHGLPAEISSSAGHFVCNHVFFHLMHNLRKSKLPAGFIHVPYLPEQAQATGMTTTPSMTFSRMEAGLRSAFKVLK
jgi:pyroglutamyl-peptidase